MSLILKRIDMPKEGTNITLTIKGDGTYKSIYYDEICGDVIQIPKGHGRLIDGDELRAEFRDMAEMEWNKKAKPLSWSYAYEDVINEIDLATTIIEAEE